MLAFSFSLSIVFSSSSGSVQCSVSTIPSFYNFCFKLKMRFRLKTTEDYRRRKSRERESAISANCISRAWVHSVWKCWNLESKNEKKGNEQSNRRWIWLSSIKVEVYNKMRRKLEKCWSRARCSVFRVFSLPPWPAIGTDNLPAAAALSAAWWLVTVH